MMDTQRYSIVPKLILCKFIDSTSESHNEQHLHDARDLHLMQSGTFEGGGRARSRSPGKDGRKTPRVSGKL